MTHDNNRRKHPQLKTEKPGTIYTNVDGVKMVVGVDMEEDYPYCEGDEFMPYLGEDDNFKDHTIKLAKGESVCVQLIDPDPERRTIARHYWYGGTSVVCPEHTSKNLLTPKARKPECPLCKQGILNRVAEWFLPVIVLARQKPGRDMVEEEPHLPHIIRVKVNEKVGKKLIGILSASGPQPTLIYGRDDDTFGTYYVAKAKVQEPPIKQKPVMPLLNLPLMETDADLVKFAATVKASQGIEPQPGRVSKYRQMFPGCPLIALVWGRKKPVRSGYTDPEKVKPWMLDEQYLKRMDESCGIMVRLEKPFAAVDLDRDEDIAEFLNLNPWAEKTHRNKGGRGGKFFAKIKGDYPADVLDFFDGNDHVGEFRGAGKTAIIDGLHPSGKLYTTENEGQFAEIEYADIKWPKGWKLRTLSRQHHEFGSGGDDIEGGLLDPDKLKNVHPHPRKDGAIECQCPACAEEGRDNSGNHLIVFEDGRFGCVVNPEDSEHRSRIFALAKRDDLDERRKPLTPNEAFAQLFPEQVKAQGDAFDFIYKERKWTNKEGEEKKAAVWTPTTLNECFFACLLTSDANPENPAVFDYDENRWVRYDPERGCYSPLKEQSLHTTLEQWLLGVARKCKHFLIDTRPLEFHFRSEKTLAPVVAKASGRATVTSDFWERPELLLPVANGVLDIAERRLMPHAEKHHFRGCLDINYVPGAASPYWLKFLGRAAPVDDVELFQRWFGLLLLGRNIAQKFLLLTGTPQSGKGVVARVANELVGPENMGTLRTDQLNTRFEIGRLRHKLLIYGADVPANFLSTPGAAVLKAITGEDPISPEYKNSNATPAAAPVHGSVLVTSNSRLRMRFEGDQEAWRRRMVLVQFTGKAVTEEDQITGLAEELMRREGSGILNWGLEGARKVLEADGKLLLNERQQKVRDQLIMESESYVQFAKEAIEKSNLSLTREEAYAAYVRYCHDREWTPESPRKFGGQFKQAVADQYGVTESHDLRGGTKGGWRGIALKSELRAFSEEH